MPHKIQNTSITLEGVEAKIFFNLLFRIPIKIDKSLSVLKTISQTSGITLRKKFSTSFGVRIGRP